MMFFDELEKRYLDTAWIIDNSNELYDAARLETKKSSTLISATSYFLLSFPSLIYHPVVKRWYRLGQLLMKKLEGRKKSRDFKTINWKIYILQPQEHPLISSRKEGSQRIHPYEIFEIYAGLLMAQFFCKPISCTPAIRHSLLNLVRHINSPYCYNKSYQMLAFIYCHFKEYQMALDWLDMTYAYWDKCENTLESAITAYVAAIAHKGNNEAQLAIQWMEKAASLFAQLDCPLQQEIVQAELEILRSKK